MAKKIGIIRCDFHSVQCNGAYCFSAIQNKAEAFSIYDDDIQLVGYATCGGCCGRDAVRRAKTMVDSGAEAIHLSGCLYGGNLCPFKERIKSDIEYLKVPVVLGTHHKFEQSIADKV